MYAHFLMARLETRILERVNSMSTISWRYVDDVFTFWPHGEGCFKQFVEHINSSSTLTLLYTRSVRDNLVRQGFWSGGLFLLLNFDVFLLWNKIAAVPKP